MKRKYLNIVLSAGLLLGITSCNKYLDVLPDNRAELNNTDKIAKMLVSAYPENSYLLAAEISSDNVDDYGVTNPYSSRFLEEIFNWEASTETNNDGIDRVWSSGYGAIASANAALTAIEEAGSPVNLNPQKGEALVARAYNHFLLVNLFAQHYSKTHSATDLGITYMTTSESTLDPKYQRNTVEEVYNFIVKDLEEGIPLINDASYANSSVSKYHFNKAAANTFAARVHLFMGNWQKAAEYATLALNNNPTETLRDYVTIASFAANLGNISREYNASSVKANFLISTAYSAMGTTFGAYYTNSRFSHGAFIARSETALSNTPYGNITSDVAYRIRLYRYSGTNLDKAIFPRATYMFEYTDPVAGIGFSRGVFAPITSEEALLTRAEANIQLKKYSDALADMQIWVRNTMVTVPTLTEAGINTWANNLAYFTPTAPTPKKKFNSEYNIETGTQENMLHAVLFMRRIQTLHTGMRWFDVKRYGIEITRRTIAGTAVGTVSSNTLAVRDNRRAMQLPQDVINAGLTPNPR
ncbi:RagB/SusD family nutrient uptake outer membrane protein [Sphingobacterium spiritivorum]|uniref:SusD-like N-terminal domain-containing protein n=1 Tax=Sphingobacterium spiritivorum ATCC 33861 TaxID=525373 RepID=D7VJG6_SPHSI|nr:RagB/SusD family nutrient uptake outer membrane protein [Sphingobacterium spiritivorum]EFK59019.1 hypothetical protein HMPREF0766_11135 [Sphingobacterium spiritivorum ATCC 33861]QQT36878.1 RagB/SusD family nutrient uptake outer membrane protein [Sphingobacterium spiritivorum]WQD33636.1 RagB/SusD family nutrient uptake outer membrane protein [Sphingobacterium spiritivorum]SUJ25554.1 Uncharacterised protein [Sphingobacterium spiritivorum]